MRNVLFGLVVVALVLAAASNSYAAVTNATVTPSGTGGVDIWGTDWLVVHKDFNPSLGGDNLGPVDVNVTVNEAGDYYVAEQSYLGYNGFIHNASGYTWTDFHFQLIGGGTFGTFNNDTFASVSQTNTTIDLWNGSVPNGTDFHAGFFFHAPTAGTYTIRERASVPEPSTLVMLGLGIVGLLAYVRRQK